jgi:vancomycin resistance protein YoaR
MTQRPPAPDQTLPDETVRMPADGPGGRPPVGGRPSAASPTASPVPAGPAAPPDAPPAEAPAADAPAAADPGAVEREVDDTRPVGREWLDEAQRQQPAAVEVDPSRDTVVVPPVGAPTTEQAGTVPGSPDETRLPSSDEPPTAGPGGPDSPDGPPPAQAGGRSRWRRPALLVPVGLLLLLTVVYGVDVLQSRGEVLRNTVVSGVDIGGLTPAAAGNRLEERLAPTVAAEHTVVADDVTLPFSPADAGLTLDVDGTVDAASAQPLNPWTRLTSLFTERRLEPVIATDDAALTAQVERVAGQVDRAPADATITVDGTTPSVVEPTDGRTLDREGAAEAITAALASGAEPTTPIELPVEVDPVTVGAGEAQRVLDEVVTPALAAPVTVAAAEGGTTAEVPVAAIAASLRFTPQEDGELAVDVDPAELKGALGDRLSAFGKPARDARFEVSGGQVEVVPSVDGTGVDPQRLADQLLPVLTEPAPRTVTAELGPVPADLTTEEAEALGITEEISSFTTNISNPNSGTNIRVVAEEVDGAVVLPGETFSLNTFTGPRGTAQGYVPANVISGGQLSTAVGGGISQFATTMFNAVFFAGLEDVYHKPHSFYISRYPAGREATVYEGVIDLQWRNDGDTGVFIDTQWTPGSITVTFYGTKRFEIESISSPRTNYRQPKVLEKPDDGDCIAQSGVQGFDITVTRVFKDLQSGAEIRRENFATSYIAEDVIRCVKPKADEDAAPRSGAPASPSPGG